ncbi:TVP38/TMEM64 family protein [uncultured Corynebacterium sp.]|uniref:TVP38/TMEM64 family protein n=1 Tax=uncultured Corynebacterium sp. TaxID=159447 RepID=UPI0025E54D9C|nr:TVP38/TMEM64 family protein [uncultured Corynebacterium sp.]
MSSTPSRVHGAPDPEAPLADEPAGHDSRRARRFWGFARGIAADAAKAVRAWTWRRWLGVALGLAAIAAFLVLVDVPALDELREYSHRLGPWFPVAFWCGYVIFTLFPIPRTVWTVSAGLLFGPWEGLALSLTALTASAALTVVGIRALLEDWLAPRLRHPAVHTINEHLQRRGWVAIGSLRMIAGIPFSILNYAAALTPIPLGQFALATLIGSIPTTALGVFFGDTLTGHADPVIIGAMIVFGLVGAILFALDAHTATHSN